MCVRVFSFFQSCESVKHYLAQLDRLMNQLTDLEESR
jgi:hypothetical protein